MVHSRTGGHPVPPTGRQRWTRSGVANGSVRAGQSEHLGALTLRESTPDAVRLVDLQRVRAARHHGRTLETHRFCLRLASGSRGSALSFRMEEEGTRHSPARRVQLPVPQISIWAGKAPCIRHFDPLWSVQTSGVPTEPGMRARSVTRSTRRGRPLGDLVGETLRGLPRWGRIRADPGADDDQTLDRFSSRDKTLILFFVDLGEDLFRGPRPTRSSDAGVAACGVAHTPEDGRLGAAPWPFVGVRLLSAVRARFDVHICPNYPLCGTYREIAKGQGYGGRTSRTALKFDETSTPSAGGIT